MPLYNISQIVLSAVYNRLSNSTTGFNPGIVTNAANYGIPPFIQVDWSPNSQNFLFGQVDPALLDETGILSYPFTCLYIKESAQTGEQRFSQFSGLVRCIFEVHLSFIPIRGQQNFESYCNCVEDVVIDVINRIPNQNWGKPLVYNGSIQAKRSQLSFGAQNWKQIIGFSMLFNVHTDN